jgi:Uma2 family endonuclease
MTALSKHPPRMTIAEFVAWDDGSGARFQLIDGIPQAMAPARPIHGALQVAAARLLENHLIARASPCRAIAEAGVVPRVRADINLRVPDVAVTCAALDVDQRSVVDPVVIVEILSPSNEAETRESVRAYTTIPSVREILVLHSTHVLAELFRREPDGSWPANPLELGPGDPLELRSLDFSRPLAEFYARTPLAAGGG